MVAPKRSVATNAMPAAASAVTLTAVVLTRPPRARQSKSAAAASMATKGSSGTTWRSAFGGGL
jgi:hypothetical protein